MIKKIGKFLLFLFLFTFVISCNDSPKKSDNKNLEYICFESDDVFTIEAVRPGNERTWDGTMYYSYDNDEYILWDGKEITSAATAKGYKIYFRGVNNRIVTGRSEGNEKRRWIITGEEPVKCTGNIMALLSYTNLEGLMGEYCFSSLFYDNKNLVSAPYMPSKGLERFCYREMFSGCINLKTTPNLPAETLPEGCYEKMFFGCSNIIEPADMSPRVVSKDSCREMYMLCTALERAPSLPALIIGENCYNGMFKGCSSLKNPPSSLPALDVKEGCYDSMFMESGVVSSIPLPAKVLARKCYEYMFSKCENLVNSAAISAIKLDEYCYYNMFSGCLNLEDIPNIYNEGVIDEVEEQTKLVDYCCQCMFSGCKKLFMSEDEGRQNVIIYDNNDPITVEKDFKYEYKMPSVENENVWIPADQMFSETAYFQYVEPYDYSEEQEPYKSYWTVNSVR